MSTTAVESPFGINQYSLLSVEEVPNNNEEVDDITEAIHVIKPTTRSDGSRTRHTQAQKEQHQSRDKGGSKSKAQDPENHRNRDNYVAIMGDSMLKFIDTRRLRNGTNKKLAVKTFPGAKVDDMIHYVKPTLMKHPKEVIMHVGTNDISTKSPTEIIKSVSALGEAIMTEDPAIDLTFSEVVLRNDDKGFADKVKLVNDRLDSLCTKTNWGLISHKNIKAIHLNGSGLHLNRQGSAILAKNIKTQLLILDGN